VGRRTSFRFHLNECRENLEAIIEELWLLGDRRGHKTGYYRKKARSEYLSIAKQRKPKGTKIRKAIGGQLRYVGKGIDTLGRLFVQGGAEVMAALSEKRIERIMSVCEVHRQ
jgi:hypothetical protein